jgi:hypothetical protein
MEHENLNNQETAQLGICAVSSRFIILEGCPKYLSKGVRWVKTTAKCKRDGEPIWQEQKANGELLNIFGCSRSGCSWTDYDSNKRDIVEQLNGC